jgi:hypothetical protein
MAVTRDTLIRIARTAGDERTDTEIRAVAWRKLGEFKKLCPDAFTEAFKSVALPLTTPDEPALEDVELSQEERALEASLDASLWLKSHKG